MTNYTAEQAKIVEALRQESYPVSAINAQCHDWGTTGYKKREHIIVHYVDLFVPASAQRISEQTIILTRKVLASIEEAGTPENMYWHLYHFIEGDHRRATLFIKCQAILSTLANTPV